MKQESKLIDISLLKVNKSNPRFIKDEKFKQLVKSIQEFPEMLELREILVDEDMTILGGNMRYKALQELKIKEVYVKIVNGLTEKQKKELIIKDNVSFGDWEWDIVANEFDEEKVADWGLDIITNKEADIDFDNIKPNNNREKEQKTQLVTCPHCEGKFNIGI